MLCLSSLVSRGENSTNITRTYAYCKLKDILVESLYFV